ncbi:MAG: ABC transporter substrate-binding protein [Bacteroidia bacterium]|nr:ABC transporter substrate-binding protein [Bacteroidia bacterium]
MRKLQAFMSFLLIAFAFAGCNSGNPKNNRRIKIGAIFSSTGVAGDYGKKSSEGIQFAVDAINANGGINGKEIEVVYEDAKSNPKDAISALNKLVTIDNVKIILGDVYSSTTKVLIDNLPDDILLFAPGASSPELTNLKSNFIRNWTSDDFDGSAMANVVLSNGVNEISTLTQNSDYTISLNKAFVSDFKKGNGRILSQINFDSEKNDYKPLLQKLKDEEIKTIYLTALSKEMGLILKQSRELNYSPQWFSNLTVNSDDCKKIAGSTRDGVIFSKPYIDLSYTSEVAQKFIDDYRRKYGSEPDETVCHAYDAMNLIAEAMKHEGTNINKLIKYINSINNYKGLSGVTTFDGKGGVVKSIEVLKVSGDSLVSIKIFSFNDGK